jgi:hypothetical protein
LNLHECKQAFVAAARARAKAAETDVQRMTGPGKPLIAAQRQKLFVDEIVDGFIQLFEPRRVP